MGINQNNTTNGEKKREKQTKKYDKKKISRKKAFEWVLSEMGKGNSAGVIYNDMGNRAGTWAG